MTPEEAKKLVIDFRNLADEVSERMERWCRAKGDRIQMDAETLSIPHSWSSGGYEAYGDKDEFRMLQNRWDVDGDNDRREITMPMEIALLSRSEFGDRVMVLTAETEAEYRESEQRRNDQREFERLKARLEGATHHDGASKGEGSDGR